MVVSLGHSTTLKEKYKEIKFVLERIWYHDKKNVSYALT